MAHFFSCVVEQLARLVRSTRSVGPLVRQCDANPFGHEQRTGCNRYQGPVPSHSRKPGN
jgi:hypothetical protein